MLYIRFRILLLIFFSTPVFINGQSLPIKPERTISFTTSEGSNMSFDVSPDGKQLLFVLLGDIHIVSSQGGNTRQLTHGIGLNSRPKWFPDGKSFSYISDCSGYLRKYKQSIKGEEIVMLPDSNTLAIATLNSRSPNGRYHAYIKDSNENKVLVLYDSLKDSKKILVSSLLQKPYSYSRHTFPQFVFSPDSRSIYIGYGGKIHQVFLKNGKDKIIPFVANVKSDLGAFVYNQFPISYDSFELKYARSVNRRTDGKQVVFSALGNIYTMNLPGGAPELLVEQDANQFQPIYSLDGKWIAYVTWSDKHEGQLWKVKSSGGQPEQLTRIPGNYQRPAWSPDGSWIAIVRGKPTLNGRDDEGIGTLELISTNGDESRYLEDSVPLWNNLSFSADGKKIIFQPKFKARDDHKNGCLLVAKSIDGAALEVLAEGPEDKFILQRALSPDGKYLAYSSREDIYLVQFGVGRFIKLYAKDSTAIKIGAGVDPVWESNSQKLSWTYGNHFYSTDCEQIKKDKKNIIIEDIQLSIKSPSNYGKDIVAIRGARIITMKGSEVIENGTIVIKNGRISNIGKTENVAIPQGTTIHEAKGKTVIPGFIDLHLHMRVSPDIFPQQSWMFLANLAYGVTTARDPALSFDSFGYTELLRSGKMTGPRLYSVGRGASIGGAALIKLDNFEEARDLVKKRAALGATVVKQYMLPSRKQKQWLLMACKEAGLNMTNEGAFDPFPQIAMIKDGSTGIEHNPIWGEVYSDIIQLFARSGVFFTPAIQLCTGTEEYAKEYFKYKYWKIPDDKMKRFIKSDPSKLEPTENGVESLENILSTVSKDTIDPSFLAPARINARMIKAGVKVGLGSHGNDQGIGVHNELWALQMGGITNLEALRAATLTGAEALGIQNDVGSLEIGKIADLIILNKNPLDDIHNSREIQFVMKDGILYDGNTLNEVWPQKKQLSSYGR